jgi:hypothetical protein
VRKWGDSFRDFIYTNTLPWDDSGWRIGRVDRHMDFMAKAGDKMRDGEEAGRGVPGRVPGGDRERQVPAGQPVRSEDYPGVEEVRGKFRFTLDVSTLPNADDFRIIDGVPQEEVDKLVGIAKNSVETRVQAAMDVAYEKLYQVVAKMATTLEQYGNGEVKKFNDTLVGNISELVDAMPALNITGDAEAGGPGRAGGELAQYAAMDLRKRPEVRKAAITEAKALAKEFKPEPAYDGVTTHPEFGPRPVDASVFADMLTAEA